jgi:hypothetical protein
MRHRHDAPAQYDFGSTLYPMFDGCCSGGGSILAGGAIGGNEAATGEGEGGSGATAVKLRLSASSGNRPGLAFAGEVDEWALMRGIRSNGASPS